MFVVFICMFVVVAIVAVVVVVCCVLLSYVLSFDGVCYCCCLFVFVCLLYLLYFLFTFVCCFDAYACCYFWSTTNGSKFTRLPSNIAEPGRSSGVANKNPEL